MKLNETEEYRQAYEQTLIALAAGVSIQEIYEQMDYWESQDKYEYCLGMQVGVAQWETYKGYAKVKNVRQNRND
jgi:hypothetical protein